ncbi:MAG: DUF3261 domain-containing protein [bacterium]|nr:DUF3261 domain-containing protein [bacterium]
MKRAAFLGLFLVFGTACQPLLRPDRSLGSPVPPEAASCSIPHPQKSFRAIHAVDISLPLGRQSTVLGIIIADLASGRLRTTLLSLEGLMLFDATSVNSVTRVHHALPPLDAGAFAENLVADVKFLFWPENSTAGIQAWRKDGVTTCRRATGRAGTLETVSAGSGARILRQYDEKGRLLREAAASGPVSPEGFPQKMRLEVHPLAGDYSLSLELVEGELIGPSDSLFEP